MTEEQLQAECTQWYWNTYRFTTNARMLFAVNNNSVNRTAGAREKAVGTRAGVSDLIFILPGQTIYIEMKLPGATQLPEQIEFQKAVEERGHLYIIIRTFETFKKFICQALETI